MTCGPRDTLSSRSYTTKFIASTDLKGGAYIHFQYFTSLTSEGGTLKLFTYLKRRLAMPARPVLNLESSGTILMRHRVETRLLGSASSLLRFPAPTVTPNHNNMHVMTMVRRLASSWKLIYFSQYSNLYKKRVRWRHVVLKNYHDHPSALWILVRLL